MRNIKRGFTRESYRRMGLRFSGRITPNLLFRCRIVAILWSPKPATGVRISPPEPNNNATVPEWPNGKDCKSFVRRFKSDPLLQLPCQFNGQNQSLRNSGWGFDSLTGRQVLNAAVAQLVERYLAKVQVTSSRLVSRSSLRCFAGSSPACRSSEIAAYGSLMVKQQPLWCLQCSGNTQDCDSCITGSNPVRHPIDNSTK